MITSANLEKRIRALTPIKEQEYLNILKDLDRFQATDDNTPIKERYQILKDIQDNLDVYFSKYPNSNKLKLLNYVSLNLKETLAKLIKDNKSIIEKSAFLIGDPNVDGLEGSVNLWKDINPDYKFTLYYDSEIGAAKILLEHFRDTLGKTAFEDLMKIRGSIYEYDVAEFERGILPSVYKEKRKFSEFYKSKRIVDNTLSSKEIIKEFLLTQHSYDENLFEQKLTEINKQFEDMGGIDIRQDTSLYFPNQLDYQIYDTEVFRKLHVFDSSNILRASLLEKLGGVYLDCKYLPKVKPNVFEGIDFPSTLTPFRLSELKEYCIIKNKNYFQVDGIKDRILSENYDNLDDSLKKLINERLDSFSNPSDIFINLGDIECSELTFLTNLLHPENSQNLMIVAHKESIATNTILDQMRRRYSITSEFFDDVESRCDTYEIARNAILETALTNISPQFKKLFINLRFYLESGFIDVVNDYNYVYHLNGMKLFLAAAKDILTFKKGLIDSTPFEPLRRSKLYINFLIETKKIPSVSSMLGKDFYRVNLYSPSGSLFTKIANQLGVNIKKGVTRPIGKPIDVKELNARIKKQDRFVYDKEYLQIILITQDDETINDFAIKIFSKYPENSILIQVDLEPNFMYHLDPITKNVIRSKGIYRMPHLRRFRKSKVTIVAHGDIDSHEVSGKKPKKLLEFLTNRLPNLSREFTVDELEVNLFACRTMSLGVPPEQTYAGDLLFNIKTTRNLFKTMAKGNMDRISVSSSPYKLSYSANRTSIVTLEGAHLEREESVLRGLISKYLFTYEGNNLVLKPKNVNEALEVSNTIVTSFEGIEDSLPQRLSLDGTDLEYMGVYLDYQDIADSSIAYQPRSVLNSELQNTLIDYSSVISLAEELNNDILSIADEHEYPSTFLFDLDSVNTVEHGGYNIRVIDSLSGHQRELFTERDSFYRYKELSKNLLPEIKKNLEKVVNGEFIYKSHNLEDISHVSTLNAAFLIQALLDYAKSSHEISSLETSLQVQIYTQIISSGIWTVAEGEKLASIISEATQYDLQVLPKLIKGLQTLGFVVDGINLGAVIYELINTKGEFQKKVVEAKLGIAIINFSLSLATTVAYVTGAASLAGVLSVLAIPLVGVGIGIPSLVNNFLIIKENATECIKLFEYFEKVKTEGLFSISEDGSAAIAKPIVPIKTIDLNTNYITVGEMYISSMGGGSIVRESGFPLYFSGPQPLNRDNPLLFSNILYPDQLRENILRKPIIVLPSGVSMRYNMEHDYVAGVSYWDGIGVRALDEIKEKYGRKFHWRYSAGAERALTELKPIYRHTEVKIICDKKDRIFIAPVITEEAMRDNLEYSIDYDSAKYTYVFQYTQFPVHLKSNSKERDGHATWVLDVRSLLYATKLENGEIKRTSQRLRNIGEIVTIEDTDTKEKLIKVGGQKIYVAPNKDDEFYLSFDCKGYEVLIHLNLHTNKLDRLLVTGNIPNFTLNNLQRLNVLKNSGLPEEILRNASININMGMHPHVEGTIDIMDINFIIKIIDHKSFEKSPKDKIKVTGGTGTDTLSNLFDNVINPNIDQSKVSIITKDDKKPKLKFIIEEEIFSDREITFYTTDENAYVLKKYNEQDNALEIFMGGSILPIIDGRKVGGANEDNKYILQIKNDSSFVVKSIYLSLVMATELLSIIDGTSMFDLNFNLDYNSEEQRPSVIKYIKDFIVKNIIKNSILGVTHSVLDFKVEFDEKVIISCDDIYKRKLNFILTNDTIELQSAEWEKDNFGDVTYFKYNNLDKQELIIEKRQEHALNNKIVLEQNEIVLLEKYIKDIVINSGVYVKHILLTDFIYTSADQIKPINILLPSETESIPLTLELPFEFEELSWKAEDSNLIIYISRGHKTQKVIILDAFLDNNAIKKLFMHIRNLPTKISVSAFIKKASLYSGND